jgi:hypothetical protein
MRAGFVYLMYSPRMDAYKIGFSEEPLDRLRHLGLPDVELVDSFIGTPQLERYLHAEFEDCCIGGEWFDLGPEALALVKAAVDSLWELVTQVIADRQPPAQPKLLAEIEAAVDAMTSKNVTIREIATETGSDSRTVNRALRSIGIQKRSVWIAGQNTSRPGYVRDILVKALEEALRESQGELREAEQGPAADGSPEAPDAQAWRAAADPEAREA